MTSGSESPRERLARKLVGTVVALGGLTLLFVAAKLGIDIPWWGALVVLVLGLLIAFSTATTNALRSLSDTAKTVIPGRGSGWFEKPKE